MRGLSYRIPLDPNSLYHENYQKSIVSIKLCLISWVSSLFRIQTVGIYVFQISHVGLSLVQSVLYSDISSYLKCLPGDFL